jgi:hypothetical protein
MVLPAVLHAGSDTLQGIYEREQGSSEDIAAAVEATVSKMNFVIRSMARKRLLQNLRRRASDPHARQRHTRRVDRCRR